MLVDFDMFVDIVDACRHEFVDQPGPKLLKFSGGLIICYYMCN